LGFIFAAGDSHSKTQQNAQVSKGFFDRTHMWHKRNIWYSKEVIRQLRLQECSYEERSVTQMNHLRLPLNEEGL